MLVPNLEDRERQQLKRFAQASQIMKALAPELKQYADEFATQDDRHKRFVKALKEPSTAAVLAFHLSEETFPAPSVAVDKMIENLEKASRDTPQGLVIDNAEAWEKIEEIMEAAERASERLHEVKRSLKKFAAQMDRDDPMSANFADQIETGVAPYYIAAEIPYAELDLNEQLKSMLSNVMEPVDGNGMKIRDEMADEVNQKASEILNGCRNIRRHLRKTRRAA